MRKSIVPICVAVVILGGLLTFYFLSCDSWEEVVGDETYFYSDEIEAGKEQCGEIAGLRNSYDEKRYRKYKIKCIYSLVEGECETRLIDSEDDILKEWSSENESFEEELDKTLFEKTDKISTISENKNCVGVCTVSIYGKRKHFLNIKLLFDDL